ncbi:hypothetical protein DERF_001461, partial [Dermatophagoides farinae]
HPSISTVGTAAAEAAVTDKTNGPFKITFWMDVEGPSQKRYFIFNSHIDSNDVSNREKKSLFYFIYFVDHHQFIYPNIVRRWLVKCSRRRRRRIIPFDDARSLLLHSAFDVTTVKTYNLLYCIVRLTANCYL